MMEWISVKDRLPVKQGWYLGAYHFGVEDVKTIGMLQWTGEKWKYSGIYDIKNVTHWMPLHDTPED